MPYFCIGKGIKVINIVPKKGGGEMPVVDNLNIQISASARKATQSLDTLTKKLDKTSSALSKSMGTVSKNNNKIASSSAKMTSGLNRTNTAMKKADKSAKSLAHSFGMFYANFFLLIRGFKALWKSIESTADYIEAYNYFNVALGKIGADWEHQFEQYGYADAEAYANSFSARLQSSLSRLSGIQIVTTEDGQGLLTETGLSNLGMNIKEITQYASQLASVTNSVGQTGETSLAVASTFTKLAGDISSLFNIDYSSVSQNFQSGLIGQSRALYKYGIDITNATLQTYAYDLALNKSVSEMTQMEKMQLRVLAILDQSKVAWGDLANTIESPSNQIRIFKNNMSELGTIIGQLFIPLLSKVLPLLNGLSVAFKRLFVDIATFFGLQLDMSSFGQGYVDLEDDINGVTDSLEDATNATKKLKNATLGIDELNILGNTDTSSVLGGSTIDLTQQIVDATNEYEKAWSDAFKQMEKRMQSFASKFDKALAPIKNLFYHLSIGDFGAAGNDVSNMAIAFANFITKALESVDWQKVGNSLGEFLEGIDWGEAFDGIAEVIMKAIESALKAWKGSFDAAPIETAIITAISLLSWTGIGSAIVSGIWNSITTSISNLGWAGIGGLIVQGLSMANPGMIGELGIWLDNLLRGTFLDTSTWTGVAKDADKAIESFIDGIKDGLALALNKLFNFDTSLAIFADSGAFFDKIRTDIASNDWLSVGADILSGIGAGIAGSLYFLIEPIADLFAWTGELINDGIETLKPYFSLEKWKEILGGVTKAFDFIFNGGVTKVVINALNALITAINDAFSFEITLYGKSFNMGLNIPLVELPQYKNGGFPEDGLFFANHNELVGGFSNGKTAVANNEQIVEGIKYGVREAVSEVLAPYLADIAQNTRETADKDLVIGDRDIARANNRGQRQIGARLITEG